MAVRKDIGGQNAKQSYLETETEIINFNIKGDEKMALKASEVVGVVAPRNGARDALTLDWFHSNFGKHNSPKEYRLFRAFLHGYCELEYTYGVRQGITIQQAKQDGIDISFVESNRMYMASSESREKAGLAFVVGAPELVKWVKDAISDTENYVANVTGADRVSISTVVEGVEEMAANSDEFSNEWFRHVFGGRAFENQGYERNLIRRAITIGIRCALYAGAMRGMEIEKRRHRGEQLRGADLDLFRGRQLWRQGYEEDYIAAEVEKAREQDTALFLED